MSLLYNSLAIEELIIKRNNYFNKVLSIFIWLPVISINIYLFFGQFIYFNTHFIELISIFSINSFLMSFLLISYAIVQLITLKVLYNECGSKQIFVIFIIISTITTPILLTISFCSQYNFLLSVVKMIFEILAGHLK